MRSTHWRLGKDRLRGELQSVLKKNDETQKKKIGEENKQYYLDRLRYLYLKMIIISIDNDQ